MAVEIQARQKLKHPAFPRTILIPNTYLNQFKVNLEVSTWKTLC